MTLKSTEELRSMKVNELHAELDALRRHLFDLRSQSVTEKLEDVTMPGKTRKAIARVLTMLRQHNVANVEQTQNHLIAQSRRR